MIVSSLVTIVCLAFGAQTHEHPAEAQSMMPAGCPMNLQGVEFEIDEVAGAVAVAFRIAPERRCQLRERVRQAASMLQRMGAMMAGGHSHAAEDEGENPDSAEQNTLHGMMTDMNMMRWPAIESVTTEDTENGIRLLLVPGVIGELETLQRQVEDMVEHMESGQSMMMQMMGHMHGPMDASPETDTQEHDDQ